MSKTINWIVIAIFTSIVLYYMIYVAGDISNTTSSCEAITFEANETLTAPAHTMLLYPTPLLYDSDACDSEVTNYTYEAGGYTIGFDIENDDYYGTYDYDSPTTVFGLGLSFIAILVTLGVALVIALKTIFK